MAAVGGGEGGWATTGDAPATRPRISSEAQRICISRLPAPSPGPVKRCSAPQAVGEGHLFAGLALQAEKHDRGSDEHHLAPDHAQTRRLEDLAALDLETP